jgi:hypothetical protein
VTAADFVARLEGARRSGPGWIARCPAHDDRTPSLSVVRGADGRTLLYCHAGCTTDAILAAMGFSWTDVFADEPCRARPKVGTKPPTRVRRRPRRPPRQEVRAVWENALSVLDDDEARAWLGNRDLDPLAVHVWDLARVLPHGASVPRWAWGPGGPWSATHRLIVPLFGGTGAMESLHARALLSPPSKRIEVRVAR